jgi:hypothetical protein
MHIIHNQQEQKTRHKGTLSSKYKLPQDNYPTVQRTTGQLPNGPTYHRAIVQRSNAHIPGVTLRNNLCVVKSSTHKLPK